MTLVKYLLLRLDSDNSDASYFGLPSSYYRTGDVEIGFGRKESKLICVVVKLST